LTRIQVLNDGRLSESDRNGFLSRVEEIVAPYLRSDPAAIREALATNAM
jgi:hypothetical protein